MQKLSIIPTIHPRGPFIAEVARRSRVSGVRLNTVIPTGETPEELLTRLKGLVGEKEIWIDLKCRQIRTDHGFFFKSPAAPRTYQINGVTHVLDPSSPRAHGVLVTPPWAMIRITHRIRLNTSQGPVRCYLSDGISSAHIVEVIDGSTLIMLDGPQRVVGGGESINIMDPSLEIEGYLTPTDVSYIEAAKRVGLHHHMLSYVEQDSDITDVLDIDPEAVILAKIESPRGVQWVKESYDRWRKEGISLMAARGDLYVEMARPDRILHPLRRIIKADHSAVLASRILSSLRTSSRPSCADICDVACMLEMGYRTLMVGDDICFNREALMLAIDVLDAIAKEYEV